MESRKVDQDGVGEEILAIVREKTDSNSPAAYALVYALSRLMAEDCPPGDDEKDQFIKDVLTFLEQMARMFIHVERECDRLGLV